MALLLFALGLVMPAGAQTVWFKYEGNPVLDVGPVGSWDGALVIPDRILADSSGYRMWYTGFSGTRTWQAGHATSSDGVSWTKYARNPVLESGPQAWETAGSTHPYVVRTARGFEMWYTGGDQTRTLQLGRATSFDGIRWMKDDHANPILRPGPPGSWGSKGYSRPSVIGPGADGILKMWYAGEDSTNIQIGYATSSDGRAWITHGEPVLRPGLHGSWDELSLCHPRVLQLGGGYQMWFGGMSRDGYPSRRVGYATSTDGIRWTKSEANPVLAQGPAGAWDNEAVLPGDVVFDGHVYHMWYHGIDRSREAGTGRIGYAVSPNGLEVDIGPAFVEAGEPVVLSIRLHDAFGLSFSAEVRSLETGLSHRLDLLDDGTHGDGQASDGKFANSWIPPSESHYVIDLLAKYRERTFRLHNAATVTSIGPLRHESVELIGDRTPNPGDTLLVRVGLRNFGLVAAADGVEASILPADSCLSVPKKASARFGSIPASEHALTSESFPLYVRPDCRPGTETRLHLSIASVGVPLWSDAISVHIAPPWWETKWAFGLFVLMTLGLVAGALRYVESRKLRRRIQVLEAERTVARERARISQDMHDDVGAQLAEIGILSELARSRSSDPGQVEADIGRISEISREVTASMSEIIWAIDSTNDSLDDLVAYLRHYASKFLDPTGITLSTTIPAAVPSFKLTTKVRRNVFLAVKESLHNIVKHSGATAVNLSICFTGPRIQISIEDNGSGFEIDDVNPFGNGLRSMEKRMAEVRGTFEIESVPGSGSTVSFICICE